MTHYAILATLDDKAMPRSRQARQLISATCLPRILVVTPPHSFLFLATPGLDHQVYESPSSNPFKHLTETLETSRFRHAFLGISPHRGISFGDRFFLLESNSLSLKVEKG